MSETTVMVNPETPATGTPAVPATPGTEASATPAKEPTAVELQAELEGARNRISELNKENEKRRKQQEEFEKEKQAAIDAQLAEQGKFKDIADKREAERNAARDELASANEKLTRLNEILSADVSKRTEKWPDEVKKLIPAGDGVDALTQLESVTNLEPLALKLMASPPRGGSFPGPPPSGGAVANADAPRPPSYRI